MDKPSDKIQIALNHSEDSRINSGLSPIIQIDLNHAVDKLIFQVLAGSTRPLAVHKEAA